MRFFERFPKSKKETEEEPERPVEKNFNPDSLDEMVTERIEVDTGEEQSAHELPKRK